MINPIIIITSIAVIISLHIVSIAVIIWSSLYQLPSSYHYISHQLATSYHYISHYLPSSYDYISGLLACSQSATSSQLSPTWDQLVVTIMTIMMMAEMVIQMLTINIWGHSKHDPKAKHPPALNCHHHKYRCHPKATSRSATQYKVCRLKQVEVVAHVVHHIPNHDDDDKHDFHDDAAKYDLKTVFPWNA